jgi:hypothetical protein
MYFVPKTPRTSILGSVQQMLIKMNEISSEPHRLPNFWGGGASEIEVRTVMSLTTEDLPACAIRSFICRKYKIINDLLVEAAGVEPGISIENTQLTDSENASISKSSVQITYKDFPELQNFQASPTLAQHAEVLSHLYTSIVLKLVSVRIIFRGRIRRHCLRIIPGISPSNG